MHIVDTHATPFQTYEDREIKPDVTLYQDRFQPATAGGSPAPAIDRVAIMAEFKFRVGDDPFDDTQPGFERTEAQGQDTLGQICSYATAQMAGQFRTHLFSLLIFPNYARILRWDRAGVIVTEKIDLLENSSFLAEFLWRYDHMTTVQQGFDEHVQPIDLTYVEQTVPDAREKLDVDEDSPLFSIRFPNDTFVITTPTYMGAASPTGRSTRTFKALHMQTGNIVFLKDTWRVVSPGLIPEHAVYNKLADKNVPHVATVLAYQDLPGHVTRTADYENAPWVRLTGTGRFRKFQHYRLVLREVANPIQSFRNTKELVQVFRDALKGKKLSFAFCSRS